MATCPNCRNEIDLTSGTLTRADQWGNKFMLADCQFCKENARKAPAYLSILRNYLFQLLRYGVEQDLELLEQGMDDGTPDFEWIARRAHSLAEGALGQQDWYRNRVEAIDDQQTQRIIWRQYMTAWMAAGINGSIIHSPDGGNRERKYGELAAAADFCLRQERERWVKPEEEPK